MSSKADNGETHRRAAEFWELRDVGGWCQFFHEHDSVYIDPIFGEYRGRHAIERWLTDAMGRAGQWRSVDSAPPYFDGATATGEAILEIPIAREVIELPFCWVQRYHDGTIRYRRDYYDSHQLRQRVDPTILDP